MLTLTFLVSSILSAAAQPQNYPYRSDYLWVTVPDHADWTYKTGEQATVEVQFYKYGIPRDGIVEYGIGSDLIADDTQGKAELKNGRCTIKMGTARKPCFRDLRLRLHLDGTTYQHHVKVGFSPEDIRPYTQQPKDFRLFWDEAVKEAAKYPLKYTKELQPQLSNDKTDCYLIKLDLNRQHQSFYGYLMMPKQAKPGSCPVVLSPPGAGVKRIKDPNSRDYYPEHGVIRLISEIHGMDPRMPESYFEDIRASFDGRVKGYLYQGLDDRDHYYMKHVYLGLVRCIDLLTSLPEWDGRNVITVGGKSGRCTGHRRRSARRACQPLRGQPPGSQRHGGSRRTGPCPRLPPFFHRRRDAYQGPSADAGLLRRGELRPLREGQDLLDLGLQRQHLSAHHELCRMEPIAV